MSASMRTLKLVVGAICLPPLFYYIMRLLYCNTHSIDVFTKNCNKNISLEIRRISVDMPYLRGSFLKFSTICLIVR